MTKIAVISDVHGNLEALKAVLEDIKEKKIEKIYCLGDTIGKGNRPNECLSLLKDSIMVYGNWEDAFNNNLCSSPLDFERFNHLNEQLSEENKERIKALPLCQELYISWRLVRLFHASPNNAWDNILPIDRIEELYKQFLPTENTSDNIADVAIYSHTHMQNLMKLYNRTLINVGSVGNSFDVIRNDKKDGDSRNTTSANYLIIEGEINSKEYSDLRFEFISLNYDINKELEDNKNNPEFENYSKELLTGKFRNLKKYKDNFEKSNYDINKL